MSMTRRNFLQTAALFSAAGLAPRFLTQSVAAEETIAGFKDDRILVVVQLGGGNDGLNTVVPYNNDTYYRLRPALGLRDRLLTINDELALNPSLTPLMRLYDDAKVSIIEGVGYPNPDRSHFRSMEIWHTATGSDEFEGRGWLGRYFDNTCSGSARPHAGVAIGNERPQAFEGERGFGIATDNPARFGWIAGNGPDNEAAFNQLNREATSDSHTLDFLRHTTTNAVLSSKEVQQAAERGKVGPVAHGRTFNQLDVVAGLIRGGLQTRIYYVSTSGFDTHANQLGQQDRLLGQFAEAVARFQDQLEKDGAADRVLTLVFSEFGRRVHENASGGTDHGTAAPMFLVGRNVKAGIHGSPPDLDNLDEGDLRHTVDFRSVYASVLEQWLAADAQKILLQKFDTLPLIV
ncbi:MAG: DUF1501 domain-containing protein [Candidatus Hydrogenedentes bacterium]|nr:DUF1501 domain-containing protein [Candidatus Hydrogenedentota bacterium]